MPELPEVEHFRRLLLPLKSNVAAGGESAPPGGEEDAEGYLQLERLSLDKNPPRKFLSDEDIGQINDGKYLISDIQRKGKLLCLVLERAATAKKEQSRIRHRYLFVHMGMTGRISTPQYVPKLESIKDSDVYPPPHTYLRFIKSGTNMEACFSDPRKFGSILLKDTIDEKP